jgi:hypothetical protein
VLRFIIININPGTVYTLGRNQDNRLGVGTWTPAPNESHWREMTAQRVHFDNDDNIRIVGITARAATSAVWTSDGLTYFVDCFYLKKNCTCFHFLCRTGFCVGI